MNFLERALAALAALIEQRDAKNAELDAFATTLDDETRSATPDEDILVDLAVAELRDLNTQIDAQRARVAELEKVAADRSNPTTTKARSDRRTADDPYDIELRSAPRTAEVRRDIESRALKALETERSLTDEQRDQVERMLRSAKVNRNGALSRHLIATGRPEYRSAFAKLVRMDGVAHLTEAEYAAVEEVRAINITTDGDGGFLMPFTLDPSITLVSDGRTNPMRQLATVRSVVTDNWQGVNTTGVVASMDDESEVVSDDSPAFTQPSIAVKNAKAFIPFTVEAEDDFQGLAADASELIFDAIDDLEASQFATGTGTLKQVQGLVTALIGTASEIETAGIGTYTLADIDALSDAVPDRYDARAAFLMHRSIVTATRNLGDATGDPVTHLASGGPMQLRNRDVYKYSKLDSTVAAGNEIALCGDYAAAYRIHDRLGVTIERVQHLFDPTTGRPTGERGWFARKRFGAGCVNINAVRLLQVRTA